jgi:hypothetical protein
MKTGLGARLRYPTVADGVPTIVQTT